MIEEQSSSSINYLIVINVYDFFTLKKTLKRPFKAILKSFKLLLIFYRIHFIFSFFTLHTLQSRTRKSYPHFHKPFEFAILRGCSSLFTYTVFLILLFLLHLYILPASNNFNSMLSSFKHLNRYIKYTLIQELFIYRKKKQSKSIFCMLP